MTQPRDKTREYDASAVVNIAGPLKTVHKGTPLDTSDACLHPPLQASKVTSGDIIAGQLVTQVANKPATHIIKSIARDSKRLLPDVTSQAVALNERLDALFDVSTQDATDLLDISQRSVFLVNKAIKDIAIIIINRELSKIFLSLDQRNKIEKILQKADSPQITAAMMFAELQKSPEWRRCISSNVGMRNIIEAYQESVALMEKESYIPRIAEAIKNLTANPTQSERAEIIYELKKAAYFPYERVRLLKQLSDASKEVMSENLMRALAPTTVIGINPYPKYRLATSKTQEHTSLGIVPNIPDILIASEKLDFSGSRIRLGKKNIIGQISEVRQLEEATCLSYASQSRLLPLYQVPGFGATMQLQKFGGNNDAKKGNVGLMRVQHGDSYQTFMTSIDPGQFWKVDPSVFCEAEEVVTPSSRTGADIYHFMYQRCAGEYHHNLDDFFESSINNEQVKRENRITALHIALMPRVGYRTFAQQYMHKDDNPWLRNHDNDPDFFENETSYDTVVEEHLVAKGEATFENFCADNQLFGFFVEKNRRPQDNIFHVFQNFAAQLEGFKFYKKHDFAAAMEDNRLLSCKMEERFIVMIERQSQNPQNKKQLMKLLKQWDPQAVEIDPKIIEKDRLKGTNEAEILRRKSVEKSVALKAKLIALLNNPDLDNNPRVTDKSRLITSTHSDSTIAPQRSLLTRLTGLFAGKAQKNDTTDHNNTTRI